jgi:hypothetical protein
MFHVKQPHVLRKCGWHHHRRPGQKGSSRLIVGGRKVARMHAVKRLISSRRAHRPRTNGRIGRRHSGRLSCSASMPVCVSSAPNSTISSMVVNRHRAPRL